jgi:membrane-associated phospholipid phosphatase
MLLNPEYRWLTRFGEIGLLWPVVVALTLWMIFATRSWRLALAWLLPLGAAVFITSGSKIAFIGWGMGIPALDFTGFSGHAMFSAAIYPLVGFALAASDRPERRRWQLLAVAAGYLFAFFIAWSRVEVQAHSWSEVVAGFVLGAAASGCTLWMAGRPAGTPVLRWSLAAVTAWLVLMPAYAAPTKAHDLVTRLSIHLAARDQPFLRPDLHLRLPRPR